MLHVAVGIADFVWSLIVALAIFAGEIMVAMAAGLALVWTLWRMAAKRHARAAERRRKQ